MAKYVIMCGGTYKQFETPKQLSLIKGERVVDRTIRLLKENKIEDIVITSNNPIFDSCGVPRLENDKNVWTYQTNDNDYWLDAFYPNFNENDKIVFIWGDVYFTDNAIKTIVEYKTDKNVLFGTSDAKNKHHQNWGEPFAYIVNDYKRFMNGVEAVKKLYDEGKVNRQPIVWELYRYLHGLDINVQRITEDYVCIDDGTMDIDIPEDIKAMNER